MANELPDGWVVESAPQPAQASTGGDLPPGWTVEHVPGQVDASGASQGDGLLMNYAAGTNEGVSTLMGAPVDIATWGINRGIDAANWASRQMGGDNLAGNITDPVGGSQSIRDAQALYGGSPDQVAAATSAERIARGAGAGTTMALLPAAAATALPARAAAIATQVTGAPTAGNALLGTVAGGSGAAAAELVPEQYKPLASLIGGFVGAGTLASLGTLGRAGWDAARGYAQPFTQAGQKQIAGQTLRGAAENPSAAADALEAPAQLVPGSVPTTAQAAGDMGLLSLERSAQTRRPDLFRQRAADQNAARVTAMGGVERAGDPMDVTRVLRSQLDDIEQTTQAAVDAARQTADTATAAVGGNQPIEAYGSRIRDSAVAAENAARQRERALWAAVDPEDNLALNVAPVRQAVKEIRAGITPSATPISGAEGQIYGAVAGYKDVMPFRHLTDLRSNISTEMREELRQRGRTASYARLSRLRGAVEDAINTAVERQAQADAEAVAAGQMAPEATVGFRLQQQAQEWQDRRAAEARAGQSAGEDIAGNVALGQGGVSSVSGAARPSGARSRGNEGNPGVQAPEPLQPNFDDAAAERLRAASAATKERATTFGPTTPAGAVVRNFEGRDAYRLSDAAVPARVFHPGPRGFEDVQQFRQAVGDENALPVLSDYAAASLRRTAGRADGTLDPGRMQAWQRAHAESMRAFPELAQRFATAESAERAVAETAAARRAALDNFNRQAAARLLNAQAPEDVTRAIGGMFSNRNAVTTFRDLAEATGASPEARAGVRRAIADYINGRFVGNTEVGTSGTAAIRSDAFQTFVRQNRSALAQFFTNDELQLIDNLVADLQRSNRSLNAVRIPGQSNTAQDQAALRRYNMQETILQRMATSGAGAGAGAVAGGPVGAAVGSGATMVMSAMRDAGLRNVEDLVTQAMLDPALARALLLKASNPQQADSYFGVLARRLRTISMVSGAQSESQHRRGGK